MRVLVGDVGGTKTALAFVQITRGRMKLTQPRRYPSGGFHSLERIVEDFLRGSRPPRAAGFGVAGPVRQGRAKITNLPWTVDARRLSREFGMPAVALVNDFVAAALGLPYASRRRLATLAEGKAERDGPIGLIGAGTGLGQAGLIRVDGRFVAIPSEGGHADFGPRDEREDRLARFLRPRHGRVSRELLLAGRGLANIYDFLRADGFAPPSPDVERAFDGEDRAAVITRFGLDGGDPLCRETLRVFCSIYGSEAGNLALQYRATGGVYVAGGIAPKILPALQDGNFRESFRRKPPMESLLSQIPVRVVLDDRVPLFGAAAAAYRIAIETTRPPSKTSARRTRGYIQRTRGRPSLTNSSVRSGRPRRSRTS